jgi:hypothetical protein
MNLSDNPALAELAAFGGCRCCLTWTAYLILLVICAALLAVAAPFLGRNS